MIPPHERPFIPALRQLGFTGSDEQSLWIRLWQVRRHALAFQREFRVATGLRMATVCPSADALDGKVHLTVANLNNKFHRALRRPVTEALLRAIFRDEKPLSVHSALPQVALLGKMKARRIINRLGGEYGSAGVQLLSGGREEENEDDPLVIRRAPYRSQRGRGAS